VSPAAAASALRRRFGLSDAGLKLRTAPTGEVELRTDRIFLDSPAGAAALHALPGARGVLTYFVNELRVGDRATPYSMVAALDGAPEPVELGENEIVLNEWEAQDLNAHPGSRVTLKYFVVGPLRKLTEETREFRVRAVVPI